MAVSGSLTTKSQTLLCRAISLVLVAWAVCGAEQAGNSADAPEAWVKEWKVLSTLMEYGQEDARLYYTEPVRAGFGNPCPGRKGILYLHPPTETEPARLARQFKVTGAASTLVMGLCGNKNIDGDFVLAVKVDDKLLGQEKTIAGAEGWQDVSFDLSGFRDKEVTIQIEARSNNWLYEYAFFDYIRFVEDISKVKVGDASQAKKTAEPDKVVEGSDPNSVGKLKIGKDKTEATVTVVEPVGGKDNIKSAEETATKAAGTDASAVVFEDNFDSDNMGRGNLHYRGFRKWLVRKGEVDLVGNGFSDTHPGNGLYVGLNGTKFGSPSKAPGALQSKQVIALEEGKYVLEFALAWQGGTVGRKVNMRLGIVFQETLSLDVRGSKGGFRKEKRVISIEKAAKEVLIFECTGNGSDYVLLDDIKLTKVSGSRG
ncbi:MAG: hypothetical protein JXN61_00980 [Sedimentisphaerales bacterium]|nr:hypothetical protein [Sedimentisphaerales bacterium]